MWKATNPDGSLMYTFLDSVSAMYPYWAVRFAGGLLYFAGILVFAYNLYMTSRSTPGTKWPAASAAGSQAA
jgi:cytochrome c oxidase cbb3-type subunit 1